MYYSKELLTDFRRVPKSANNIGQFWMSIHFPDPPVGVVHLGGGVGICSRSIGKLQNINKKDSQYLT